MNVKIKTAAAICILIASALLASTGTIAFADDAEQELNQNISAILDGLDLSALENYLKEHGNDYLFSFGDSAREIVEYLLRGDLAMNYSGYIGQLLSVLFSDVLSLIPAFAQITALTVLCSLSSVPHTTRRISGRRKSRI